MVGVCFLLAGFGRAAAQTNVYTLGVGADDVDIQVISPWVEQLYARAGLEVRFVCRPHTRSLILANEGELDGEAARIFMGDEYPNLIRIKEPLTELKGAAYIVNPDIREFSPGLFEKYRTGYVLGVLWAQDQCPLKNNHALRARDHLALFQMLLQGRLDIALTNEAAAQLTIQRLGESALPIRRLSNYQLNIPIYHYINKRHAAIIPRLEQAMQALNSEEKETVVDKGDHAYTFYSGIEPPLRTILELRLTEAFRRLGKTCRVVFTGSSQRALVMADQQGDGDLVRLSDIKTLAPGNTRNLLVVPEPLGQLIFCTYTRGKLLKTAGWDSLAGYRNGIRIGAKILEAKMPGQVIQLPDTERLFKMLESGRLDTLTEQEILADSMIRQKGYAGINKLAPPLVSLPGFCLIHKKHSALLTGLSAALKAIKADGSFQRIKSQVLNGL